MVTIPSQQVIKSINQLMGILSQEKKRLDYLVIDGEKVEIEYLTGDHPVTQKVKSELTRHSSTSPHSIHHTSQQIGEL